MGKHAYLIAALIIAALCLYAGVHTNNDSSCSWAQTASPTVNAREASLAGTDIGEVLINGQVVFRIRTSAGGLSPYERAQKVAERLNRLMSKPVQPENIRAAIVNGQAVVLMDSEVVITADEEHARLNNTTPMRLAESWAVQLSRAVQGLSVAETPLAEKVVPIISVGSGTRIGGALVSGNRDRIDDVRAVAQVEGTMGNSVRVRIMVPVSTENVVEDIKQVPETSVTGLVDIRL